MPPPSRVERQTTVQLDLAVPAAHRDELVAAGADSGRDLARGVLRLDPS